MEEGPPPPFRVFFFPMLSPGHMLPMLHLALDFSRRGAAATLVTTPANAASAGPFLDLAATHGGPPMTLLLIPFPSPAESGLPPGCENYATVSRAEFGRFFMATAALRHPFRRLLQEHRPDALVSDVHFPWTADLALELGVPRFVFHPTGAFALCVVEALQLHGSHASVAGEDEAFVVEGLPHRVEMTRRELPETVRYQTFLDSLREAEAKSAGAVVNTFVGLEPAYAELYRMGGRRRAWYVGPVSLHGGGDAREAERGGCGADRLLGWLDSRAAASVVYVCFGSVCELAAAQLREIALGLEASRRPFVWVVREGPGAGLAHEWMPEGFEERLEGRGVLVRGWAPQVGVLGHGAVGGFVTHCGWNSVLEGVAAGKPMVTWPLAGEQFVNEKLVVEVLRVGRRARARWRGGMVMAAEVVGVVAVVMGDGEEAKAMGKRAEEYGAMARVAMEAGGSSYEAVSGLIEELWATKRSKKD